MFDLQSSIFNNFSRSSRGLICGVGKILQMEGAPLLPKLRGYFAEFLRKVSLARLSLLDSPTCVGLRYGRFWKGPTAFLGRLSAHALCPKARLDIRLSSGF